MITSPPFVVPAPAARSTLPPKVPEPAEKLAAPPVVFRAVATPPAMVIVPPDDVVLFCVPAIIEIEPET